MILSVSANRCFYLSRSLSHRLLIEAFLKLHIAIHEGGGRRSDDTFARMVWAMVGKGTRYNESLALAA
jgi:hypothetical protein